jgi:hypothetical protein
LELQLMAERRRETPIQDDASPSGRQWLGNRVEKKAPARQGAKQKIRFLL